MMNSSPSVDQLSGALRVVADLVTGVGPEQWSAPTPCTDWNVHQLVNHLVAFLGRCASAGDTATTHTA